MHIDISILAFFVKQALTRACFALPSLTNILTENYNLYKKTNGKQKEKRITKCSKIGETRNYADRKERVWVFTTSGEGYIRRAIKSSLQISP